jgi:myo-inositol-1(or 4)-monophosphatase
VRRRFSEHARLSVEVKASKDYVTEVDREAEAAIVAVLKRETPSFAIVAEEGSPTASMPFPRWIVDPLDGTTNFIHGVPTFGVSVAVEDASGLAAGRDRRSLPRGGVRRVPDGSARPERRAHPNQRPESLQTALLGDGVPLPRADEASRLPQGLRVVLPLDVGATQGRSGVTRSRLHGVRAVRRVLRGRVVPWDVAAGALLVTEAGGIVTDTGGGRSF